MYRGEILNEEENHPAGHRLKIFHPNKAGGIKRARVHESLQTPAQIYATNMLPVVCSTQILTRGGGEGKKLNGNRNLSTKTRVPSDN